MILLATYCFSTVPSTTPGCPTTDLSPFIWIIPCGIRDCEVGSTKELVREGVTHKSLLQEFSQPFQLEYSYQSISSPMLYERK